MSDEPNEYQKKKRRYGGRAKGTKNLAPMRLRFELKDTLQEFGFDPVYELIRVNREAWKQYEQADAVAEALLSNRAAAGITAPLSMPHPTEYLRIAESSAAQILPYIFPKLKSIEVKGANGTDFFQSFTDAIRLAVESRDTPLAEQSRDSESVGAIPAQSRIIP